MNKVILSGRITKDAEVRGNESKVASFTVACDRRFKKDSEDTADFIGCKAFGKQCEFAEKYVRKGTKFNIAGRIQTGSFTNKDGKKVYTTDVVVEEIEFAESKKEAKAEEKKEEKKDTKKDEFMNVPDGVDADLPWT